MADKDLAVKNTADEVSTMLLNKVLSKQLTIEEALESILLTSTYMVGKSMPKDKFETYFEKSNDLASSIIESLNTYLAFNNMPLAQVVLALNTATSYVARQDVDEDSV